MKLAALLSLIFSVQSAFAGGAGEPVMSKYYTKGAMAPQYRESKSVDVMPMGDVTVTHSKAGKGKSTIKGPLSAEIMKMIQACKKQISNKRDVPRPNCAGGASTSYYIGEKRVSIRTCGEINTMGVSCVKKLMEVLDQF